ncbi:MAG TPA: DinB family protein [Kouleothrix sp.]|nr:DinB family protein [Kouleothrix sp.]HRC76649.1 DinB family protein [Kouleothrix sp.]
METSEVHQALDGMLARAYAVQQQWIAGLSDADRDTPGTAERWSVKDTLAHITFWQQASIERLEAARDGRDPTMYGDFQPVNERVFEERRALPWAQVLADAEQAHTGLRNALHTLDAQQLTDPERFAWAQGQALASGVLGNGFWHPIEHVARFYADRGEYDRAADLLEQSIVREQALGSLPTDRGAALYNMACFYATTGQPARALPLLPEALRLRPDLVEWSKQDSDLDILRDDPAFQALYAAG